MKAGEPSASQQYTPVRQVELAAACARALVRDEPVDYRPLVDELRSDLRTQLGLEPIPATLELPASGPSRSQRMGGRAEGGAMGGRGGGGGGGGGMGGGAAGAGGMGAGMIAADAMDPPQ